MLRLALVFALAATSAQAVPCGGKFSDFLKAMTREAIAQGHDPAKARAFFSQLRKDPAVLRADHAQGVFQLDWITFARRMISTSRLRGGEARIKKYRAVFDRIEKDYGIAAGVITAFWAFETDYGQVQGNFNTANAIATLAQDCRRPQLFQPQLLAALTLYEKGEIDPATTTGAWAGEIGMVQMLPADILKNGTDADGDGHVSLKTSVPDALVSGAKMLSSLGWQPNQPWLQEVTIPDGLDLTLTGSETPRPVSDWQARGVKARTGSLAKGLDAALILPVGRHGPAFLAYPNFRVFLEWNQSLVYVMTAAYFATRLEGAPVFDAGHPDPGLDGPAMIKLQKALAARGYDVGKIDGILGSATRAAVQAEQERLGLPADGWPTPDLLAALR